MAEQIRGRMIVNWIGETIQAVPYHGTLRPHWAITINVDAWGPDDYKRQLSISLGRDQAIALALSIMDAVGVAAEVKR